MRLTAEQKKFYQDNGFVKLSGIFSDEEIDRISKEYDHIFFMKNNNDMETSWGGDDMKKQANFINYTVKAVHALQYHSSVFSDVLSNASLLDALEDVMQTKNILLHHTKAHFKPPSNGAPYLMHQDYHYFPYKQHSMVAAFVHVDAATPENGGLAVYPGSHKLGPQEDKGLVENGEAVHYLDQEKFPLEKATPICAARGDVVIFSYLLIHGSYLNLSTKPRRMFLIQVSAAEDEPVKRVHTSPGQGWVLRGRNDKRPALMATRYQE